ncbi:hypothetical protein PQR53_20300 [Paraburkholderia fungorum]|uniref:hypothetical protein n=1 Tax=Paraburkholderia fungorum TaxID=134537 RepID=UPI0038BBCCC8
MVFAGGVLGAVVAVSLAVWQQKAQSSRERLKMAADSAGSHMANVAFDKYVQFCEEYAEGFHKALDTLTEYGPTDKLLADAHALYQLRRKWAVWITTDTDEKLDHFEQTLREIGASAGYVQAALSDPNVHDRHEHISRMYMRLAQFLGDKESAGEEVSDKLTQYALDALLRRILGTEQLDELRAAVISRAIEELGGSAQSNARKHHGEKDRRGTASS